MSRVAAIQMASGPNVNANLLEAERLISRAAKAGAKLVVLPENFAIMGMTEYDKVKVREVDGKGPMQNFIAGADDKVDDLLALALIGSEATGTLLQDKGTEQELRLAAGKNSLKTLWLRSAKRYLRGRGKIGRMG